MKLQKHFAYKYKDRDHYKHVLILPEETVNKLGWNSGLELEESTTGDMLVLKPAQSSTRGRKAVKSEFRKRTSEHISQK